MSYAAAINQRDTVGVKAYDTLARWIGGVFGTVIVALLGYYGKQFGADHDIIIRHSQILIQAEKQHDEDARWKEKVSDQLSQIQGLLMRQTAARKEQ